MSHWNYRVFKHTRHSNECVVSSNTFCTCSNPPWGEEEWFTLREVYYKDGGSFYAYAETPEICADSPQEMKEILLMMLKDVARSEGDLLTEDDFSDYCNNG